VQPSEAKAFLISQILIEADRENISLDDIERQMLEFSEAENTPPNWQELNAEFDRDYDQDKYEEKIASLIRNRLVGLKATISPELASLELDQWHEAIAALAEENHYLQIMIDIAEHPSHRRLGRTDRPPHDRLMLIATAAAIVIAFMIAAVIANHFGFVWPSKYK
jgi:hypothetical protein